MKTVHPALCLAALGLAALTPAAAPAQSPAFDLSRIPRSITKEPAYRAAPHYCLLVLGPVAKSRIWLALDGTSLYVDRNRNGVLTDAGERVEGKDGVFTLGDLVEVDGKTRYTDVILGLDRRYEIGDGRVIVKPFEIRATVPEKYQVGSEPAFSTQAAEAPIVHLGGPLSMRVFDPKIAQRGQRIGFRCVIRTPGLGEGAEVSVYHAQVPETAYPDVEVEFPASTAGAASTREKVSLKARCCQRLFRGSVAIPADAGTGMARFKITYPSWALGHVQPGEDTIEIR
jgi:hypothetical protein